MSRRHLERGPTIDEHAPAARRPLDWLVDAAVEGFVHALGAGLRLLGHAVAHTVGALLDGS